ncbi:hypothetical protein BpHYR1_019135 [Brachionus plicatilis]|uniref:Uncharacterized protein n=1 Tax=Brachionus plicatilis TaxID=10195 RepID=A0A3M7TAJ3_BRAPC|nr:hypothetical protein BpHYR1_019135 [Brachionus plicatilis]
MHNPQNQSRSQIYATIPSLFAPGYDQSKDVGLLVELGQIFAQQLCDSLFAEIELCLKALTSFRYHPHAIKIQIIE